jgi:hypothetical protein
MLLRMLSTARENKYRIVRTRVYGLFVKSDDSGVSAMDKPCSCDTDASPLFCRLALPLVR